VQGINRQVGLTEQPVQARDLTSLSTFLSLHRLIESVSLSPNTDAEY
jgi:hypothetical protein